MGMDERKGTLNIAPLQKVWTLDPAATVLFHGDETTPIVCEANNRVLIGSPDGESLAGDAGERCSSELWYEFKLHSFSRPGTR